MKSVMTDLTTTTPTLLASGQLATDFTISYYSSALNAQFGTNPIVNQLNLLTKQIPKLSTLEF